MPTQNTEIINFFPNRIFLNLKLLLPRIYNVVKSPDRHKNLQRAIIRKKVHHVLKSQSLLQKLKINIFWRKILFLTEQPPKCSPKVIFKSNVDFLAFEVMVEFHVKKNIYTNFFLHDFSIFRALSRPSFDQKFYLWSYN